MQTAPTPSHYSWKLETRLIFERMMQIFYIRIGQVLKAGKFCNIFKQLKLNISYWIWCFVFLSGMYCVFSLRFTSYCFSVGVGWGVKNCYEKKQDVIAQELWIKSFFHTILIMRRSRYNPFSFTYTFWPYKRKMLCNQVHRFKLDDLADWWPIVHIGFNNSTHLIQIFRKLPIKIQTCVLAERSQK